MLNPGQLGCLARRESERHAGKGLEDEILGPDAVNPFKVDDEWTQFALVNLVLAKRALLDGRVGGICAS